MGQGLTFFMLLVLPLTYVVAINCQGKTVTNFVVNSMLTVVAH